MRDGMLRRNAHRILAGGIWFDRVRVRRFAFAAVGAVATNFTFIWAIKISATVSYPALLAMIVRAPLKTFLAIATNPVVYSPSTNTSRAVPTTGTAILILLTEPHATIFTGQTLAIMVYY